MCVCVPPPSRPPRASSMYKPGILVETPAETPSIAHEARMPHSSVTSHPTGSISVEAEELPAGNGRRRRRSSSSSVKRAISVLIITAAHFVCS